jgi:hypothetical protein
MIDELDIDEGYGVILSWLAGRIGGCAPLIFGCVVGEQDVVVGEVEEDLAARGAIRDGAAVGGAADLSVKWRGSISGTSLPASASGVASAMISPWWARPSPVRSGKSVKTPE